MTSKHFNREMAFTRTELAVIVATIAMLLVLVLVGVPSAKERARRQQCVQNLKKIALAFRQWTFPSGDRYPQRTSTNYHGTMELGWRGDVYPHFLVMSNELGSPKLLVCPSDNRTPSPDFATLQSNTNISYFVGIDAEESYPQMFLAGDRNPEIDGVAAKPGIVNLQSNNMVGWTREMHNRFGNVALADGSVQGFKKLRFGLSLQETAVATNRLAIP